MGPAVGPISQARKQAQKKKRLLPTISQLIGTKSGFGKVLSASAGSLQEFEQSLAHASEEAHGDYKPLEGKTKLVTQ